MNSTEEAKAYIGDVAMALSLRPDEFVTYLTSVTGGFLNLGSVDLFRLAMAQLPETGAILEIGNAVGQSLIVLAQIAKLAGRTNPVFSCDYWPFPSDLIAGTSISKTEYRTFAVETFLHNVKFFARDNLPYSIEASADQFFDDWEKMTSVTDMFERKVTLGGPIAFAHIDGWHEYDAVKSDATNVDRWLVPGGFIVFDDSADDCIWEDVKRVTAETLASGRYELVSKGPNYLVRKLF